MSMVVLIEKKFPMDIKIIIITYEITWRDWAFLTVTGFENPHRWCSVIGHEILKGFQQMAFCLLGPAVDPMKTHFITQKHQNNFQGFILKKNDVKSESWKLKIASNPWSFCRNELQFIACEWMSLMTSKSVCSGGRWRNTLTRFFSPPQICCTTTWLRGRVFSLSSCPRNPCC